MSKTSGPIDGCNGITITVKVVPGSSRTESAGLRGQAYKIKIAAPPEKGKANKILVEFLAERLNIKKNAVQIINGKTSCIKQILLRGINEQDVRSHFG